MIAIVTEELDQADVEATIAMFTFTPNCVCVVVEIQIYNYMI